MKKYTKVLTTVLMMIAGSAYAVPNTGNTASAGAIGVGIGIAGASSNTKQNQTQSNNVTVEDNSTYKATRTVVSTAYAPSLASNWNCNGSTSVGGQTRIVGISFGTTKESKACLALILSERMQQLGFPDLSVLAMCEYPNGRELLSVKGIDCDNSTTVKTNVPKTTYSSTSGRNSVMWR